VSLSGRRSAEAVWRAPACTREGLAFERAVASAPVDRPKGLQNAGDTRFAARGVASGSSVASLEIELTIGGRAYRLPERSALLLCDCIRRLVSDERPLSYIADTIDEDLAAGGSLEPIDLGTRQIETLADILWGVADGPLSELHMACERYMQPG
jgi:hypothetical protein